MGRMGLGKVCREPENEAIRQEVGESIRWTKWSVEMSMSHRSGEAAGLQVLSSGNYGNTSRVFSECQNLVPSSKGRASVR